MCQLGLAIAADAKDKNLGRSMLECQEGLLDLSAQGKIQIRKAMSKPTVHSRDPGRYILLCSILAFFGLTVIVKNYIIDPVFARFSPTVDP
jgi:hypothetical protein